MKKTRGQLCLTLVMTFVGLLAGYFLRGEPPRALQSQTPAHAVGQQTPPTTGGATIFVYSNEDLKK